MIDQLKHEYIPNYRLIQHGIKPYWSNLYQTLFDENYHEKLSKVGCYLKYNKSIADNLSFVAKRRKVRLYLGLQLSTQHRVTYKCIGHHLYIADNTNVAYIDNLEYWKKILLQFPETLKMVLDRYNRIYK